MTAMASQHGRRMNLLRQGLRAAYLSELYAAEPWQAVHAARQAYGGNTAGVYGLYHFCQHAANLEAAYAALGLRLAHLRIVIGQDCYEFLRASLRLGRLLNDRPRMSERSVEARQHPCLRELLLASLLVEDDEP